MKNKIWIFPLAMVIIALFFLLFNFEKNKEKDLQTITFSGLVQGTTFQITYLTKDGVNYQPEIMAELRRIDKSMSVFDSTSTISRINKNEDVEVDSLFKVVFLRSQEVAAETDGAFDITVGPLVRLWGFNQGKKQTVTQAMVDRLKPFIGYQKVKLEGNRIIKQNPNIQLDFNAIAQGFSSDWIAHILDSKGIDNYMVEIGGEIMTKGNNPRGAAWRVGINKPVEDSTSTINEIEVIIKMKDAGLATSGNYHKFYYHNGKKYAHEINPATGYPVEHNLLSVTVIAPNATDADAYATACMIFGLEKSKQFIEKLPDTEAYFIYLDKGKFETAWTKGFGKYFTE
jgi:thiamine biosynthesis lipoprotein